MRRQDPEKIVSNAERSSDRDARPRISPRPTCRSPGYTGGNYSPTWNASTPRPRNHPEIAKKLVEGSSRTLDAAWSNAFKDGRLLSHAHTEPILYLVTESGVPVVPLFVNAVHPPAPSAARCYAFGQALRRVIDRELDDRRIVLCASGGLSHFSPSHPWAHHVGARYVGDISVDFDRRIVAWMRAGEGHRLRSSLRRNSLKRRGGAAPVDRDARRHRRGAHRSSSSTSRFTAASWAWGSGGCLIRIFTPE